MNRLLAALAVSLLAVSAGTAADAPITTIVPYPGVLKLRGMDDAPQLLITG